MIEKIKDLLVRLRDAENLETKFAFLPDVIQSLESMKDNIEEPIDRRERMAGALQRLVTEDYSFSESQIGGELLLLADDFASKK